MAELALLTQDTTLTPDDLKKRTQAFKLLTKTWTPGDVVVSDIETNGLLYEVNRLHCGTVINPFLLEEYLYEPGSDQEYLAHLARQGVVVGHNFKGYDLLALRKLFGFIYSSFCFDTLVLSRLTNPERKIHNLESYGRQFGFPKIHYETDWQTYDADMGKYCRQDGRLNAYLFLYQIIRAGWCEWFGSTKPECERLMKALKAGDIKVIQ